jgi:citronellol/citronellal dehydrogenase
MKRARRPSIMADAAYLLLTRNSRECTGNFFVDEDVLRAAGMTEFDGYSLTPGSDLIPDFFV